MNCMALNLKKKNIGKVLAKMTFFLVIIFGAGWWYESEKGKDSKPSCPCVVLTVYHFDL